MISPDHVRLMARYNAWQNRALIAAAETLDDAARRTDRGGFWGGIQSTLIHVLWGDTMWMARFDGWEKPAVGQKESPSMVTGWDAYTEARADADARILDWAGRVEPGWLAEAQSWYSGSAGRQITQPRWALVTHFFNHQTHHRGQVHAMLTAAGARPGDTDLFLMPEDG